MRVLLDEDVHVKVLDWLIENGHDAVRVSSGLKNGQVIELAQRESRILLRIHPPRLEELVGALKILLAKLREPELKGRLVIAERQGCHLLA